MNDTRFLSILASVMRECSGGEHPNETSYDSLYAKIKNELRENPALIQYPNAPAVMLSCDRLLDDLELLYIYPELVDRAVILFSCQVSNTALRFLALQGEPEELHTVVTSETLSSVPFLVSYGEAFLLQAINYVGERITLSVEEYLLLLQGCRQYGVALNQIVKVFALKVPLKHPERVYLCDNRYRTAQKLFDRYCSLKFLAVDESYLQKMLQIVYRDKNYISRFNGIICAPDDLEKIRSTPIFEKAFVFPTTELASLLDEKAHPLVYGFVDEFLALKAAILAFYASRRKASASLRKALTQDVVRLGKADQTIDELRKQNKIEEDELREAEKAAVDALSSITTELREIEQSMQGNTQIHRETPTVVFDFIFQRLFQIAFLHIDEAKACEARLLELSYDNPDLLRNYLLLLEGKSCTADGVTADPKRWEQAKMFLAIADIDSMPVTLLKKYLRNIGTSRLSTGKEYYARSLAAEGMAQVRALQQSASLGYLPAAEKLCQLYQSDPTINIRSLVNALDAQACMLLGAQEYKAFVQAGYTLSGLRDPVLFHFKLAAVSGDLEALEKIVTLLFGDVVFPQINSNGFPGEHRKQDVNCTAVEETCVTLCRLCEYLIAQRYDTAQYRLLYGIMLCYLDQNMSEAFRALSGKNSAIAMYGKGYMYEYGRGTQKDLEKAKRCFTAAEAAFPRAAIRRKAVEEKIERQQRREAAEEAEKYDESKDYHASTSTEWGSSSFCFITTAACIALQQGDDCDTLTALRAFRDQHLRDSAEGQELVEEYYRVAPTIVEKLNALPNCREEYLQLWNKYIQPSCAAIQKTQWEQVKYTYVDMVMSLCERFDVAVNSKGFPSIAKAFAEHKERFGYVADN